MMSSQFTLDFTNIDQDKIKTKFYKGNRNYKIFNCIDDPNMPENDPIGRFRSVITNEEGEEIVAYSPPKTASFQHFKEQNPDINADTIIVNELIEGTMITLFYDKVLNIWEIATKGAIGGKYWFYRTDYETKTGQKTFRKMFLEALRINDDEDLNNASILNQFSKDYCYNFILQHPANHIVFSIEHPKVYLVAVYKTEKQEVCDIPNVEFENFDDLKTLYHEGIIHFPMRFLETDYAELEQKYCSIQSANDKVGLMFMNIETGLRSSLENPTYSEMRILRGNHPNLQYQYLCLLKMKKVKDFLKFFPQYNHLFFGFYKDFQQFVTNVHASYISYYVKKTGEQISKKYFPIIYKLHHNVYLPSLAKEKIIMKKPVIFQHIIDMHPVEIIYYLNFNR
jgi:hypothetical protein